MRRFTIEAGYETGRGDYILFTDHEAAIKKAVEDERKAIVQYLLDQGSIESATGDNIWYITDEDIAAIRSRGEK